MSKIKIQITLKTPEQNYQYIVPAIWQEQEETLTYQEPNEHHAIVKFNFKTNELFRENDMIKISYKFNETKSTKGTVFLKELRQQVTLKVITKKLHKNLNNVDIDYCLEAEFYQYKIEVI